MPLNNGPIFVHLQGINLISTQGIALLKIAIGSRKLNKPMKFMIFIQVAIIYFPEKQRVIIFTHKVIHRTIVAILSPKA